MIHSNSEMNMTYLISMKYLGKEYFCLMECGEEDLLYLDNSGSILLSKNKEQLLDFATRQGLPVDKIMVSFDFNIISRWVLSGGRKQVNCSLFFDFYSFYDDACVSINRPLPKLVGERLTIFNKLFYGCNLPVFTPAGCEYIPLWRKSEIKLIKLMLNEGLIFWVGLFTKLEAQTSS